MKFRNLENHNFGYYPILILIPEQMASPKSRSSENDEMENQSKGTHSPQNDDMRVGLPHQDNDDPTQSHDLFATQKSTDSQHSEQ